LFETRRQHGQRAVALSHLFAHASRRLAQDPATAAIPIVVVLKAQDAHEDTVNLLAYQKERERLATAPRISALAID
jgi:CheY-like chemotaxis protein